MRIILSYLVFLLAFMLSSCSMMDFHKRRYMPGRYHNSVSNPGTKVLQSKDGSDDRPLTTEAKNVTEKIINKELNSKSQNQKKIYSVKANGRVEHFNKQSKDVISHLTAGQRCEKKNFKKVFSKKGDDTKVEKDSDTKLALRFALAAILLVTIGPLIAFLLYALVHAYSLWIFITIAALIIGGISYLIAWVFSCRAMHRHRNEKEKYPGRGLVRLIFWSFLIGAIGGGIGGLIFYLTFETSGFGI